MNQADKKNVFLCGCARSGTSALWRLMTAHTKFAIGLERYIGLCNERSFTMSPAHFEKERFYTLKRGDTHFPSIEKGGAGLYYTSIKDRFDDAVYFGDKTPKLFKYYEQIFKAFPKAKILFIYRNIFDVAQSFNTRKAKVDDSWDRDYKMAVSDWNISMKQTNQWLQKRGNQILPISYEELFFGKYDLQRIFDFLEIENEEAVPNLYRKLRNKAAEIEGKRADNLSSLQKKYIMRNARFNFYNKVAEFDKQRTLVNS